jgi:hypothetical protein
MDPAGCAHHDLGSLLQGLHVVANASAANACMAFNVHEVTNGDDNLLNLLRKLAGRGQNERLALLEVGVNLLEDRDREGGGLSGTRLGLCDDVVT